MSSFIIFRRSYIMSNAGNFLSGCTIGSFSRRAQLHEWVILCITISIGTMKQYDFQWSNRLDHVTFVFFISVICMGVNFAPQCGGMAHPDSYFTKTVSFRNYNVTQNNLTFHLPVTIYRLYKAHTRTKNATTVFHNVITGSPSFHCRELLLTSFISWGTVYVIHVIWVSVASNLHRRTLNQESVYHSSRINTIYRISLNPLNHLSSWHHVTVHQPAHVGLLKYGCQMRSNVRSRLVRVKVSMAWQVSNFSWRYFGIMVSTASTKIAWHIKPKWKPAQFHKPVFEVIRRAFLPGMRVFHTTCCTDLICSTSRELSHSREAASAQLLKNFSTLHGPRRFITACECSIPLVVQIWFVLPPGNWVTLEKPPVAQLLKNFSTLHGPRRFITAFTRDLHWSLPWTRSV
jgi:hypothetical protein